MILPFSVLAAVPNNQKHFCFAAAQAFETFHNMQGRYIFPGVVIFSLDGSKGNYTYTEMQNFAQTRQGKSPAAAEIVKSDQCSRL